MIRCSNCNSTNVKSKGMRLNGSGKILKYSCNSCGHEFATDFKIIPKVTGKNLVVTSVIDGFSINDKFLQCLLNYCEHTKSELIILPVNHNKPFNENKYPKNISSYMKFDTFSLSDSTNIMAGIKLSSTLESPLHGMDSLSKGKNVVFGHPQVQLKTLPRKADKYPAIIVTTGTISIPNYNDTKTSHKANFNHSFSALFIDGKNPTRMRHLNYDGVGFYDLHNYYTENEVKATNKITAIVTGDEHIMFYDSEVMKATYDIGGIVSQLSPDFIIRHDVLDCYSISHHHQRNIFTKYGKHIANIDSIESELIETINFIKRTTPTTSKSIIISSNHNSHLVRWLNEADPKTDMVNCKIYHQLMYMMLDNVKVIDNIPRYPDPFTLWAKDKCGDNVEFLSPFDSYTIHDIDINNHGDLGINGAKGNNNSYKNLPLKSIIGHSHSPGIEKGSYQVGTSSNLRLDYNKGLSSWHHTHCIIYPNGKRQLIFVIDGAWK